MRYYENYKTAKNEALISFHKHNRVCMNQSVLDKLGFDPTNMYVDYLITPVSLLLIFEKTKKYPRMLKCYNPKFCKNKYVCASTLTLLRQGLKLHGAFEFEVYNDPKVIIVKLV